jgi:hypothetical protein
MSSRTRIGILIAMLLLAGFLVWLAFFYEDDLVRADVESAGGATYSLVIPPDMEAAYFNNDNAAFQYHSEAGNYSMMVIDDSKEKIASFGLDYDLDTYMKIATRALDSAGMYVNTKMEVNGMDALQATIQGTRDGVATAFILTCVETPTFYYQLICWTPADRYEANKAAMDDMIESFREENPQPVQ